VTAAIDHRDADDLLELFGFFDGRVDDDVGAFLS
jgi:hypothetical protein